MDMFKLDLIAFDELAGPSTADVRAWHFSYLLELMMSVHWMILLGCRGREPCATGYGIEIRSAFGRMRTWNADRLRATGRE
jgi:hypothetical protein